ncbi:S-layer homology domain-containing protein [Neomoorella thermoacetica]|uniref:SLH domain-containing protein n=1 Tax=Moorella thermoacetica (strain ATCC 39073 / JCM 9320) TaxID=264732 RepID=Q2RGK4_MOOTA|nr:S-layer homology domain-containing protein [Moorella thermoacetica]AKX94984.1 cellulosome-anchoring protein precursor [Moorella thermoacetica]AKX97611.1 cellulosome-anchoring protein precursor [Moorella thermoacetica]OIQ53154.1 cellulosome-anchoring protein precursor [Moorella thermoacetica]TYL06561.1 hypothetical protein MOOCA_25360 [Moorella thermoacetica]TYL06838.1 hypothetical protein MOLA_24590 [Moorella thermoacetica]
MFWVCRYRLFIVPLLVFFLVSGFGLAWGADETSTMQSPEVEWEKTLGKGIGYSVQQTSDGGYIIVGSTQFRGAGDVYLIKTDANGNKLWEKTFGGSGSDEGYSVQQTTDGGYIIAGSTHSYGGGDDDVYLIKTDANGNKLWEKVFKGEELIEVKGGIARIKTLKGELIKEIDITKDWEKYWPETLGAELINEDTTNNYWLWKKTLGGKGRSVQQTADGGYIIAGYTNTYNVYLIKTDTNGDTLWERIFGSNYTEVYSVQQTTDGGYIIAGYIDPGSVGKGNVYLIKTDAKGNMVWEKTFGGSNWDKGYSVRQTTDGGYIIAGFTRSYGVGNDDVYLIKTDANGNKLWEKNLGGNYWEGGYSVQQTTDGGYIVAGVGDYSQIKTDGDGNLLWKKTLRGEGRSVQQTTDGGYIIAGYTFSRSTDSDVYLIKLKPETPPANQPPVVSLKDMQGHWAADAVDRLVETGVVSGYPDGTFRPDLEVTRAEIAAILVRALKLTPTNNQELKFKDDATIPTWAKDAVSIAVKEGLVKGYLQPDGTMTFEADRPVTRAEMAVLVARVLRKKLGEVTPMELKFTDAVMIPAWAKSDVGVAVAEGIVVGYPDNTFRAENHVTRAEAAVMILRLLRVLGRI